MMVRFTSVLMQTNGILLHTVLPFATLVCLKCYRRFATLFKILQIHKNILQNDTFRIIFVAIIKVHPGMRKGRGNRFLALILI
jgi:hypothetical protein